MRGCSDGRCEQHHKHAGIAHGQGCTRPTRTRQCGKFGIGDTVPGGHAYSSNDHDADNQTAGQRSFTQAIKPAADTKVPSAKKVRVLNQAQVLR